MLNHFLVELFSTLLRAISGELFTERQIKLITSHAIGKYLADWFPSPEEEKDAKERVKSAKHHISQASEIISQMQNDLESQTEQLDQLIADIEEKRETAERYRVLADTNQKKFAAFRREMESALREELIAQSEKGKGVRRLASISIWIVTLIIGAALGSYFEEIVSWIGSQSAQQLEAGHSKW